MRVAVIQKSGRKEPRFGGIPVSPVSGRSKLIWAILALVAMACFIAAWPLYKKYSITPPTNTSATERATQAVEKSP
jgi:hypothetical protein